MKKITKRLTACTLTMTLLFSLAGCGAKSNAKKSALDPKNPVSVTVWNYYNGDQLTGFENLVEDFNTSIGAEKGIVVESVSQGDIATLANSLLDSVDGKAGAEDCPTLAAIYPETAYILDEKDALVPIDSYFTEDELKPYIPEFLDEGRFNENNDLLLFPISKSTEAFAANETDWKAFADATGITLDSVKTQEDLVAAAKSYYEWTDSLTPDKPEDGKALYGRDAMANYMYIGSYQLGHELFHVENGKLTTDLDRDTFKILWDNYYIPYINGYFGAYANFRSEDTKTGKILALTSSTAGVSYLPTEVTSDDDSVHSIDMIVRKALPFANAKSQTCAQQGAGYCLVKCTEAQQEGAVEFLKWFTDPNQNTTFALSSGYSPVTIEANKEDSLRAAYSGDTSTPKGQNMLNALLVSAEEFTSNNGYATKPFYGSKDIRTLFETCMQNVAETDRATVVKSLKAGKTREEAVAPFTTDKYFDDWFDNLTKQITSMTQP